MAKDRLKEFEKNYQQLDDEAQQWIARIVDRRLKNQKAGYRFSD